MTTEKKLFGLRIKHLRDRKGWTQENLAEKMDISSNYLSSMERGKENPTLDMLIKMSKSLQVEMWELFDFGHEVSSKELKVIMKQLATELDKDKLQIAVKILRAVVR